MNASNRNTENLALVSWAWIDSSQSLDSDPSHVAKNRSQPAIDLLLPVRRWLDGIQIEEAGLAHRLCRLIPAQCPFERDVKLLGRTLFHIPPLCKLNPVYDEVVALRFRALCYLADVCSEDISPYC